MKLKTCGLRDNIKEVIALSPDYVGFIFYKGSKRFVGDDFSPEALKDIPKQIKKTGVFVNEEVNKVIEIANKFKLDAIQLHGDESPEYCINVKIKGIEIIKVFAMDKNFDFKKLESYRSCCDYFLFDTKGKEYGGTGRTFDWELLKKYDNNLPFFLSGGIGPEEIDEIRKLKGLAIYAVDINSKVETSPGLKNIDLIKKIKSKL
jgi:phosphoribosylanthranilate isomerase